jgi:hypothetical protein
VSPGWLQRSAPRWLLHLVHPLRPRDPEVRCLHVDVDNGNELLAKIDGTARNACTLTAEADDGEIHRIARCSEVLATQHMSRHDGKPQRGTGHSGHERTSRLILVRHS